MPHNFIIFKLPRTGSTFLAHIMEIHEEVNFHREFFGWLNNEVFPKKYGKHIDKFYFEWVKSSLQAKMLRAFLKKNNGKDVNGVTINPLRAPINYQKMTKVAPKVITLIRENHLKQAISILNVRAEKNEGSDKPFFSYSSEKKEVERRFIFNDEAIELVKKFEERQSEFSAIMEKLDTDTLKLTYEDDIQGDPEELIHKISNFLDLPITDKWRQEIEASLFHKLVKDDLSEVIDNYEEVKDHPMIMKYRDI